jgi:hypothetical protein
MATSSAFNNPDKRLERRLFPDRRQYSYSRYIPERRGRHVEVSLPTAAQMDLRRKNRKAPDNIYLQIDNRGDDIFARQRETTPPLSAKKWRRRKRISRPRWKSKLLLKVELEIKNKSDASLTKTELLKLIKEL